MAQGSAGLTVEHAIRAGRLRLAGLRGNPALAARLDVLLGGAVLWHAAEIRMGSGSIILPFAAGVPPEAAVAALAAALHGGAAPEGAAASTRRPPAVPPADRPVREAGAAPPRLGGAA